MPKRSDIDKIIEAGLCAASGRNLQASVIIAVTNKEILEKLSRDNAAVMGAEDIVVVPILRAGLGMTDGLLQLMPTAKVGHIGLYRDETTHQPVEYYCKLPKESVDAEVIVVDPMLATGGSASAALNFLKERGCKNIRFMCLVAAPEGIRVLQEEHPDIDIFTASVDECLNDNCYIVPGLGDAGDRIFGTK